MVRPRGANRSKSSWGAGGESGTGPDFCDGGDHTVHEGTPAASAQIEELSGGLRVDGGVRLRFRAASPGRFLSRDRRRDCTRTRPRHGAHRQILTASEPLPQALVRPRRGHERMDQKARVEVNHGRDFVAIRDASARRSALDVSDPRFCFRRTECQRPLQLIQGSDALVPSGCLCRSGSVDGSTQGLGFRHVPALRHLLECLHARDIERIGRFHRRSGHTELWPAR